jgi:hypothetical protein
VIEERRLEGDLLGPVKVDQLSEMLDEKADVVREEVDEGEGMRLLRPKLSQVLESLADVLESQLVVRAKPSKDLGLDEVDE